MSFDSSLFTQAFAQASKHEAQTYANLFRFIGIGLLLIASGFTITRFLSPEAKIQNEFFLILTTRLLKILIGLTVFALVFKP